MTVGAGDPVSATVPRWLTAANVVSLARLAATPFSLVAVLHANWRLAGMIFAGAVASDFLDGIIARWRNTVSNLGGVLDHTADAVFVAVTLWGIAYLEVGTGTDVVPGILPWFIVLAFLQYLFDSKALSGQPLRTSWLGRVNGIAYYVVAGTVIGRNALGIDWLPDEAIYWAALAVVVSTLVSMFDRLWALTKPRTD
ncbi:MAG: CDP-alcohol phosphatidyltransferase family protein [Gammaproteobacteria bacterium]|nr:CDP-alcohol phosphatidyltransferase family protein [Gammaproteobacteria bacterium]